MEKGYLMMKLEFIRILKSKFSATHSTEYMGVKPTNKRIEWEAIEIFRIENEKIAESWGYWPDVEIKEKLIKLSKEKAIN